MTSGVNNGAEYCPLCAATTALKELLSTRRSGAPIGGLVVLVAPGSPHSYALAASDLETHDLESIGAELQRRARERPAFSREGIGK